MTVDPGTPPIARLEQNLAAHPAVGSGELEKALMVLDGPAFGAWLDDLAEDPGAVARLAAASCWHANGFAKLVLHRTDGYALRLHVWPNDGRPQTGDSEPHSHRWDFASAVLAGGLTIVEYAEDPAGMHFRKCSYDGHRVVEEGPVRLKQATVYPVLPGLRYTTERSVIHKVHPVPGELVATLLVQGPHRSDTTAVYRLDDGVPPARPIGEDRVRALLRAVRRHVGP